MTSTLNKVGLSFHLSKIIQLLENLKLSKKLVLGVLSLYYFATLLNALFEGLNMLLLVSIFIGGSAAGDENRLLAYVFDTIKFLGGNPQFPDIVPFLIVLFSCNLLIRSGLLFFNHAIEAILRRRIQETIFTSYLKGDWSHMRDFRVGNAVGTNTQESMAVTKYLSSAVQAVYFILSVLVMTGLALLTSLKMSLILGAIALPLMWLMQKIAKILTRFSKLWAELRNKFSSDIIDRFNGLLQIHVDDNYDFHLLHGLQVQGRLTRLEILSGLCQAGMGSFSILLPLTALIGFSIWSFFMESNTALNLSLIASVGVLGIRVVGLLNAAVSAYGTISRLIGSVYPVLDALSIPPIPTRQIIDEPVVRVEAKEIFYAYGENLVIDGATFAVKRAAPLVLSGRSGKGKTTLANLIAGLYFPNAGQILYVGASGKTFASTDYRARVGFVTQDIYLFHGSLRSNLAAGRNCADEQIWAALEQVDAAEFVREMGGLDTESAEAGRSLSGGQRRRLGIARVLLSSSDVLIFDEVVAGLDQINKTSVLNVIDLLSKTYVVIVISHEALSLSSQVTYTI